MSFHNPFETIGKRIETLKNGFTSLFNGTKSWDDYHENGIIPNIWAGFTGQKSAEMQTQANIDESARQFDENLTWLQHQYSQELNWQKQQFGQQLDFQNRNLISNIGVANKNLNLQQSAFDYQKQLNATQMEREDTAIQRQIADAAAAGLSPLSVLGGNGASSAPLSSGSAPQMDYSGVNQAAGNYVDMARQYASLHAQATQNYMSGRNQAAIQHNSQVLGARTALTQLKADLHFKGQNMATQYFNAAVNAKNSRLQREWIQEQITASKKEREWMSTNGYRNQTLENVLIAVANKLLDKGVSISSVQDKLQDIGDVSKSKANEIIDKVVNGSPEPNKPNNLNPKTLPKDNFNTITRMNLKSLAKNWSYDKAEFIYLNSLTLRKKYNFDAWIHYYSKNIPESWYK